MQLLITRGSKSSNSIEHSKNSNFLPESNQRGMKQIPKEKEQNATIENAQYLFNFLLEKSGKRKYSHEDVDVRRTKKLKFIVDENDEDENEEYDKEDDLFDHVCAICDNGGNLLCCDGRCLRSFHATKDDGVDSGCVSLGLSAAEVEAMPAFMCENCQYQWHQCFVCGILGSSDKSSGAEVFPCVSATCGHFYHPECVANLLHPGNEAKAKELQNEIVAGESFICPAHKCFICKQGENKMVHELQFAMCRRCPKAYHRKCLPRKIPFGSNYEQNIIQRAWDNLLPNRILIYCMEHKIIESLGTAERNHIIFSDAEVKMKKQSSELPLSKVKVLEKKRTMTYETVLPEKNVNVKLHTAVKDGNFIRKIEKQFCGLGYDSKKPKTTDFSSNNVKSSPAKAYKSSTSTSVENKLSLRDDVFCSVLYKGPSPVKPKVQYLASSKLENTKSVKPVMVQGSSSLPSVDTEMEKRIVALMNKSKSSLSLEDYMNKMKVPSTYSYMSKNVLDKTITLGKVEGSVKAVRTAFAMLKQGHSIEDAKAVCEPKIIEQIVKWKKKLNVFLAPFLHGMQYTSFGRHFTKVDKLKEIVNRLQCYVQNGDMIVDFCCGANDFSCLMKEKLDQMGKRCSFKNYDLFRPKKDFSFEQRDWMSVHPKELPAGSQLIMGLNPPFGVHASLANKFINKALEFKPKLLILIVPKETRRLDENRASYDLIWEDGKILAGKSFYLPGSFDAQHKQMDQANIDPPPLYLWSHPDWTARHVRIAKENGHIPKADVHPNEEKSKTLVVSNYLMEETRDCFGDFSSLGNAYGNISDILDDVPEDNDGMTEVPSPIHFTSNATDPQSLSDDKPYESSVEMEGRGEDSWNFQHLKLETESPCPWTTSNQNKENYECSDVGCSNWYNNLEDRDNNYNAISELEKHMMGGTSCRDTGGIVGNQDSEFASTLYGHNAASTGHGDTRTSNVRHPW